MGDAYLSPKVSQDLKQFKIVHIQKYIKHMQISS